MNELKVKSGEQSGRSIDQTCEKKILLIVSIDEMATMEQSSGSTRPKYCNQSVNRTDTSRKCTKMFYFRRDIILYFWVKDCRKTLPITQIN